jgi:hypothetical protein
LRFRVFVLLPVFASSLFGQKPAVPVKNKAHPFWDNVIRAYINFEGTGTTTEDFSGNASTGAFKFGSGGSNPTWVTNGDGTGSFSIDFVAGNRAAVDCGDTKPLTSDSITVMVRFKGSVSNQGKQIVGQSVNGGTTHDWRFYWQGSVDRVGFFVRHSGVNEGDTHSNVLSLDTWYTYTGTFDGDSVAIYHNGAEREETDVTNGDIDETSGYNVYQSVAPNSGSGFDGEISFLFIWNKVLTNQEISDYTADPYQGFGINRKQRAIIW